MSTCETKPQICHTSRKTARVGLCLSAACLYRAFVLFFCLVFFAGVMMSNLGNPAPPVQCGPPGMDWVMGFDVAHHQIAGAPFKSAVAVFTVSSGPLLARRGELCCGRTHMRSGGGDGGGLEGLQSIGYRSDKEFLNKTKFMNTTK